MTWGMIEDTPYRLDGGATPGGSRTPGPVFHIPEVPKRDRIALELVERASKTHRAKKQEALKRVTASFTRSVPPLISTLNDLHPIDLYPQRSVPPLTSTHVDLYPHCSSICILVQDVAA